MIRNLKTLGLLAVAALAISAAMASAAQAQVKGTITVGETPGTHTAGEIIGKQVNNPEDPTTNVFKAFGQIITCAEATYTGATETGTETSLTLNASYTNCYTLNAEDKKALPVTVDMNGCDYRLNQPETIGSEEYTGTFDLVCPENGFVDIRVFLFGSHTTSHSGQVCTIKVTPGNNTEHLIYTNTKDADEGRDDIDVTATVGGQTWHRSGTCASGEETDEKATLHTNVTMTSPGHDLWISDEE